MARRISIAEARDRLTAILRQVERGEAVELTRRGKPVAALLSIPEYNRLKTRPGSFREAVRSFREGITVRDLEEIEGTLDELRDRTVGREVSL